MTDLAVRGDAVPDRSLYVGRVRHLLRLAVRGDNLATEGHFEDAATADQTLPDDALDDGDEPAAPGIVFAHGPATETEEDTETVEIPEYLRHEDDSGDAGDDLPKAPNVDEFDIAYEVARLLENRRWEKREEPFHGFDSPPGKF